MKKLPKIKKITRNDDGSFTAIDSYGRIYNEVQTLTGNKVTGVTVNGKTITLEYYGDELIKVGDTVVDGLDVIPEPVPTTEDKTVTYTENGNYEVNRSTGKYINKVNVTVNVPSAKEEITYEGTITSNGLYEIDAPEGKVYNKIEATVNVQPPYGELEITENGTYDVKNYNQAMVDVPPLNPYPINVTFQIPNGTSPETYTEHTKVGIKANGKIAEPTQPSIPSGYDFFDGWYDGQTKVAFPYSPNTNKTLNAVFGILPIDYVFFAPLSSDETTATTGQTLVKNGNGFTFETDSGVPCCAFNGSYYTVPTFTDIGANEPCTFSFWMKSPNASNKLALSYGNDFYCYCVGVNSENNLFALLYPSSTAVAFVGQTNDNKWHHIAFTHDGTTGKFYVDGTLVAEHNATSRFDSYGLCIGTLAGIHSLKFGGKVASVKIFDSVLTSSEITALANEFTPTDR